MHVCGDLLVRGEITGKEQLIRLLSDKSDTEGSTGNNRFTSRTKGRCFNVVPTWLYVGVSFNGTCTVSRVHVFVCSNELQLATWLQSLSHVVEVFQHPPYRQSQRVTGRLRNCMRSGLEFAYETFFAPTFK